MSVNNLMGVAVSLTFVVHFCAENTISAKRCVSAEYKGKELSIRQISKCNINNMANGECLTIITYSEELNDRREYSNGIEIWTMGAVVLLLAWNCPLNQSSFSEKILSDVKRTFALNGKLGLVYPKSISNNSAVWRANQCSSFGILISAAIYNLRLKWLL